MRRKKKAKPKRRPFIPLPDHRNVKRGAEYLAKIIEGIESGRKQEDVIQEMSLKKNRNLFSGESE